LFPGVLRCTVAGTVIGAEENFALNEYQRIGPELLRFLHKQRQVVLFGFGVKQATDAHFREDIVGHRRQGSENG
jgi:hypothetical protein